MVMLWEGILAAVEHERAALNANANANANGWNMVSQHETMRRDERRR